MAIAQNFDNNPNHKLLHDLLSVLTNTGMQNSPEQAINALSVLLEMLETENKRSSFTSELSQASQSWKELADSLSHSSKDLPKREDVAI